MINTKKIKLIQKHLGVGTPDWIISNCIRLLNEFEDINLTAQSEVKKLPLASVMPRYLSIEEVAKLYGQPISYKWLSPDGNDWLNRNGRVTSNTLREMEQESIKDVFNEA